MGAEILKITHWTSFENSELLKEFQCSNPGCGLFIDDKDIETKNYELWVSDYANDIEKSYISNQPCYSLNFWLKAVDHQECPESERCQGCYEKFRMNELKQKNEYWWCRNCQPEAFEKKLSHECEYHKPNCQKTASYLHFVKFPDGIESAKSYICQSCKRYIESFDDGEVEDHWEEVKHE